MHATRGRRRLILVAAVLLAVPASRLEAQEFDADGGPALRELLDSRDSHPHAPVDIEARPMVSRVAVALMRPRRLLVEDDGRVIVADWGAGTVIEVAPEGHSTLLASGLNEPAGLARDAVGALYVSVHAEGLSGEGMIVRIAAGGSSVPVVDGLTGPTDVAFGPDGFLYVAAFHENAVLKVAPDGGMVMIAATVPSPAALAFDPSGLLHVASSTEGALFRVSPMGEIEVLARGLHVPSDLAFDPQGNLIVANYGTQELTYVDPLGQARKFAVVPEGTIALDFDADGNLLFVNWDGQYLMKVTTHLTIPCPHCGQAIPVRLREPSPPSPESSPPGLARPVI